MKSATVLRRGAEQAKRVDLAASRPEIQILRDMNGSIRVLHAGAWRLRQPTGSIC